MQFSSRVTQGPPTTEPLPGRQRLGRQSEQPPPSKYFNMALPDGDACAVWHDEALTVDFLADKVIAKRKLAYTAADIEVYEADSRPTEDTIFSTNAAPLDSATKLDNYASEAWFRIGQYGCIMRVMSRACRPCFHQLLWCVFAVDDCCSHDRPAPPS